MTRNLNQNNAASISSSIDSQQSKKIADEMKSFETNGLNGAFDQFFRPSFNTQLKTFGNISKNLTTQYKST
jgi:hypothetical protein